MDVCVCASACGCMEILGEEKRETQHEEERD